MNISLTRQLSALVRDRVRSGRYQSASEVVREALRLFEGIENLRDLRLKQLQSDIQTGLRDLDRGRAAPFDRKLLKNIRARGLRRLADRRR